MEEKILDALEKLLDKKFYQFEQKIERKLKQERQEMRQEIKQEILDHMFVFEEEYGRKINIMFEELTAQN